MLKRRKNKQKTKLVKFGASFRGKNSKPGLDLFCVIIQLFCNGFFRIFFIVS